MSYKPTFLEQAILKLKNIPCPRCKAKNLYPCLHEIRKIRERQAVIFKCFCQSCANVGSIVVHEVEPEVLAKIKNESKIIVP